VHPIVTEDYFGFLFSVLSRNVEKGLELLGDRIRSAQFEEEAIERQKALQIAYLRTQADDPWTFISGLLDKSLFYGYPYAIDQAGSETSLAAISARSVQAWYERVVRNHKPMIFVFGDTQGTSLASYFVRRFSGSRFLETEIPESFPEPVKERTKISVPWSTDESLILVGFQGPPFGDDDYYPLEILESYLSGVGGRLREELRDRQGLVTEVSVRYDAYARGGRIVLTATTSPSNVQKVLAALEDEIHKLRDEPISFREYQTAVNATLGKYIIEKQSRFGQIHSMATAVLSGRASALFEDATDRFKEVAREDLPDLARRLLAMDHSVTLYTSDGTGERAGGTADGGE